ncbi:RICIN domain-containing protein [Kitasatospora sp. NPDC094028]
MTENTVKTAGAVVKRRAGLAAAGLAFALGGGLLAAAPASATGFNYTPIDTAGSAVSLQVGSSGKCLEVAGSRTDDGAPVQQATCTGADNQKWVFANGFARNVNSDKCLDVPFSRTWVGAAIQQWTCNGGDNQRWGKVNVAADGSMAVVNFHSDLGLDVSGASRADGAPVIQWYPNGGTNQRWSLIG